MSHLWLVTSLGERFYMAVTHCASSGMGSAAFGWIYCPHNETKTLMDSFSILYKFQMHDLRSSPEFRRAAEKSFRHLARVSCPAEEGRDWPYKSPQSCFHLGQRKQYSPIFTPQCVLKNEQAQPPSSFLTFLFHQALLVGLKRICPY